MAVNGVGTYTPVSNRTPAAQTANNPADTTFADLLANTNRGASGTSAANGMPASSTSGLTISSHAQKRIDRRDLGLDATTMNRLDSAISRAAEKGSKSSVVVLDGLAVVVDVRDRKIVTAMQRDPTRERVFTNIDSVVIA